MEYCVKTLVKIFKDYCFNLNVHLLKVEFDINPKEGKWEDCMDRALGALNAALEANLSMDIDSGLGAVC